MSNSDKSVLSFYRSGEINKNDRGRQLVSTTVSRVRILIQKEGIIKRGDADLVEYMSATSAGPWTRSSAETQPASAAFMRGRKRKKRAEVRGTGVSWIRGLVM